MKLAGKGHTVIGVDNLSRRIRVMERGSDSGIPIPSIQERFDKLVNSIELRNNQLITFKIMDLRNTEQVFNLLEKYKPEAIVHFGEIPSAPHSMQNVYAAIENHDVNVNGTLNVLWAMKKHCPEAHLIKLGTMGEYGCYDDQTEILTEDGWKLFYELDKNDKVATRTKEDRTLKFVKPNSIHEYEFEDERMYYRCGQRIDLLVTPNHRMFTETRKGILRLEEVKDIEGKNKSFNIGCEWEGEHEDIGFKNVPNDLWLEFLGWYLSEGCVPNRKDRPSSYRVEIKQNKISELLDSVDSVCSLLEIKRSVYKEGKCHRVVIWGKELAQYLKKYGKSHDKYIDKKIKGLPKHELEILLQALLKGDGWTHRKSRSWRYFSVSKRLADDVQEIALKCGYSANISESKGGHTVNICKTTITRNNTDGWIEYHGKVYCVNVGSDGIILVRRNGKPVWCGNTPGVTISEGYIKSINGEQIPKGNKVMFPRDAGSFYHQTKVHDTNNIRFACKIWGLRSTDIMQGVVYGTRTEETALHYLLATRFDFDSMWGTAVNRFVVQAILGIPLTVYGKGGQTRGYLNIRDTMNCIETIIEHPPAEGEYKTINQFTQVWSINQIASLVKKVGDKMQLNVSIQSIPNPRIESEEHEYPVQQGELRKMGFEITRKMEDCIKEMFEDLIPHKERLMRFKDSVMPKTTWK